jgi:hypothetical protein
MLDLVITFAVVAGAVGFLGWRLFPRRRPAPASCAACVHDNRK